MPQSKFTKRGRSRYIDNWNPSASKYINTCTVCGAKGYSPAILEPDFIKDFEHQAIYDELIKIYSSALSIDAYGRCNDCAERLG